MKGDKGLFWLLLISTLGVILILLFGIGLANSNPLLSPDPKIMGGGGDQCNDPSDSVTLCSGTIVCVCEFGDTRKSYYWVPPEGTACGDTGEAHNCRANNGQLGKIDITDVSTACTIAQKIASPDECVGNCKSDGVTTDRRIEGQCCTITETRQCVPK